MCYAVNQLSQAMVRPTKLHWKAENHMLRYLKGTSQYGLWYIRKKGVNIQGFIDADWFCSIFLVQKETEIGSTQFGRGRVHSCELGSM